MSDYSFSDLASTAGQVTGDFLRDSANAIAESYCSLYHDYPGFVTGASFDPITPFRRSLANSLCKDRQPGLPPPPQVPFQGGQCDAPYNVNVYLTGHYRPGGFPDDYRTTSFRVIGPIRAIYPSVANYPNTGTDYLTVQVDAYTFEGSDKVPHTFIGYFFPKDNWDMVNWGITSIEYLGVGTDSCGDPPPAFPPGTPDASRTNVHVDLPTIGGNNNITIPLVYVPISGKVDVTLKLNATIPINLNFNLGGIHFNFDDGSGGGGSGGFTLGDRNLLVDARQKALDASVNSNLSYNQSKDNSLKLDDLKQGQDNIGKKTDDIKKNTDPRPPIDSDKLQKTPRPSNEKDRDNVDSLAYVEIVLSKLPSQGKQMSGDGAPDVVFAGWFEWKCKGKPLPREQINFNSNVFFAPKEVDGYAYTLTHGALGYAVEYTLKSDS